MITSNFTDNQSHSKKSTPSSRRSPSIIKEAQRNEETNSSDENIEITEKQQNAISLLAQVLKQARTEKELRERKQLALYGGLSAAGGGQYGSQGSLSQHEQSIGCKGIY